MSETTPKMWETRGNQQTSFEHLEHSENMLSSMSFNSCHLEFFLLKFVKNK